MRLPVLVLALVVATCREQPPEPPPAQKFEAGKSLIFLEPGACKAIIAGSEEACPSADCRAIVTANALRCSSGDCVAIVRADASMCANPDCRELANNTLESKGWHRGVFAGKPSGCSSKACSAVIRGTPSGCPAK